MDLLFLAALAIAGAILALRERRRRRARFFEDRRISRRALQKLLTPEERYSRLQAIAAGHLEEADCWPRHSQAGPEEDPETVFYPNSPEPHRIDGRIVTPDICGVCKEPLEPTPHTCKEA